MHAWCGASVDPDNPEGHGAWQLCNNCRLWHVSIDESLPVLNAHVDTFPKHNYNVLDNEICAPGIDENIATTNDKKFEAHNTSAAYGAARD